VTVDQPGVMSVMSAGENHPQVPVQGPAHPHDTDGHHECRKESTWIWIAGAASDSMCCPS
jgi:hypothetical protein